MHPRTVQETLNQLKPMQTCQELPRPAFMPNSSTERVVLGVESMKRHMTDEGWQITNGLAWQGYRHCGYNLDYPQTNVRKIVEHTNPSVVVVQDIREWDVQPGNFREPEARFENIQALQDHNSLNVTILKDAHQNPLYHRQAAIDMACHAWIVYYHPKIVKRLAPYVREQDLIRTYHSLDLDHVPLWNNVRDGIVMSGAVSAAYPLRQRMRQFQTKLGMTWLNHPGYHRKGCCTPDYMQFLSNFKVAVCTSSRYGYALRKIIEATAAGCQVITDLPVDEVLPEIDGNLIRVHPDINMNVLRCTLEEAVANYSHDRQYDFALKAQFRYNYVTVSTHLANALEDKRIEYNARTRMSVSNGTSQPTATGQVS